MGERSRALLATCTLLAGHLRPSGPLAGPGVLQGRPRELEEAPSMPTGGQKAPKRFPKELPKSIILRFGWETNENVKIALPSKRQLNFQTSGALEIDLFW